MLVKLKYSRVGTSVSYNAGQIVDLPASEAQRMIEAGHASPVKDDRKPTVETPIETAALASPQPRRRAKRVKR